MSRILCVMVLVFVYKEIKSQEEIAKLDYALWENMENTTISDLNFRFNQKVSTKVNVSMDYLKRDLDFFDRSELFPLTEIDRFHQLQIGLHYGIDIEGKYRFEGAFKPTISSSWTNSLSEDDLLWNFSTSISKIWLNKRQEISQIKIGVLNDVLFGKPQIIPLFAYTSQIGNRFFWEIGFPESSVEFQFNERNQLLLEYGYTGMYSNISNELQIEDFGEVTDSKFIQNGSQLALNYVFRLQPNLTTFSRIGYQLGGDFEIQDSAGNQLYDFGQGSSIFFSMGIMYNLK
ncbi:MAG: DUF6268 family outer membrane beta-barrel protein [Bacteroidota bacterium]